MIAFCHHHWSLTMCCNLFFFRFNSYIKYSNSVTLLVRMQIWSAEIDLTHVQHKLWDLAELVSFGKDFMDRHDRVRDNFYETLDRSLGTLGVALLSFHMQLEWCWVGVSSVQSHLSQSFWGHSKSIYFFILLVTFSKYAWRRKVSVLREV